MNLFKGYIITRDKAPLAGETFKGKTAEELRPYSEVESLPDFAGIIEDGIIVVDVDDEKQSELLLKIVKSLDLQTVVYKTTRGMHFYFKVNEYTDTNKVGTFTTCGLKVDMKLGTRNSYVCLRHKGVDREVIYRQQDIQELPYFLNPINYTFPFLEMEKGDGRNQAIYNYILNLQSNEYSKQEIRDILQVINDYILVEPLQQTELDTITRDESFRDDIFFGGKNGTKFLFDRFAKFLVSEHNIIKIDNQLHIFDNGIYVDGKYIIESKMIEHIPTLSATQRREVLDYINILITENTEPADARYIVFKNGVYDIVTKEFDDFNSNLIVTNRINWNFNPISYDALADRTLDKMACYDKEIRSLMEEMIGYTFYRRNELGKAFILTGAKANGKSTFLTMLQDLLGYENTVSLDLNELGERFKTAELFGKLANIGDDIGADFISDTSVFKKLVTGNPVNVERKGQDPFNMCNYSKLLFSANDIPRMRDNTGAVLRRLVIVPFNAKFSPDDPDYDPYITYKLKEPVVMEYLINIGLKGLERVLETKQFTVAIESKVQLDQYELENNPVKAFIMEQGRDYFIDRSTNEVHDAYRTFCMYNGNQPMGRRKLTRIINEDLGLESGQVRVDGKRYSAFTEVDS